MNNTELLKHDIDDETCVPTTLAGMRALMEHFMTIDADIEDDHTYDAMCWLAAKYDTSQTAEAMAAGLTLLDTYDIQMCMDCRRPVTCDDPGGWRHLEQGIACFLHAAWTR